MIQLDTCLMIYIFQMIIYKMPLLKLVSGIEIYF